MKAVAPLQLWSALFVLALGSWILMGWALHKPGWVQFRPEYVAMVINTALCFTLLGIALLSPVFAPAQKRHGNASSGGWSL